MQRALRAWCVFAALSAIQTACQPVERAPAPAPPVGSAHGGVGDAAAAADELESGAFLVYTRDRLDYREDFSVRAIGASRLVSTTRTTIDGKEMMVGELEVDAQWRPVRASERRRNLLFSPRQHEPATFELTLAGDPPVLQSTQLRAPHTAPRRLDVLIETTGFMSLSTLCRVDREVELVTVDLSMGLAADDVIEAYPLEQTGSVKRIVFAYNDADVELLCEGDRLVAGGRPGGTLWFVREGHERRLDELKAAPRPAPHAWKHPGDALQPWRSAESEIVDGQLLVVREKRRRGSRFTTHDATSGAVLAQRVFAPAGQADDCAPLGRGRILCVTWWKDRQVLVLDARTLVTLDDLTPIVTAALPAPDDELSSIRDVKGDRITLEIGSNLVVVDLARRVATVKRPAKQLAAVELDPNACGASSYGTLGTKQLRVERGRSGSLIRFDDETRDIRREVFASLDAADVQIATCPGRTDGLFVTWPAGASAVLAWMTRTGTISWQLPVPASIDVVHVLGDVAVVTASSASLRAFAVDLKQRTVRWTAPRDAARP